MLKNSNNVIDETLRWLDGFVIDLNLCPFARRERVRDTIRCVVSDAHDPEQLLHALRDELDFLTLNTKTETTLLIHPYVLTTFSTSEENQTSPHDERVAGNSAIEKPDRARRPGSASAPADYNQFLALADDLIDALNLSGVFQIASFHPDYQFADTHPDDVENCTNRSPYPMLHLLRESSIERAIAGHPNPQGIPQANIDTLNRMGATAVTALLSRLKKSGI